MKTIIAFLLLAMTLPSCADNIPTVKWDIRSENPSPFSFSIRRGETRYYMPRFINYGVPQSLSNTASVVLRYSPTNAAPGTWYHSLAGVVSNASNGQVWFKWTPSQESTNDLYRYEVAVVSSNGTSLAGTGWITLVQGIGQGTGTSTPPAVLSLINWLSVEQVGGSSVLSNQMGSGATWDGSKWNFAGSGGGITAQTASNIAASVVGASNFCTVAAAQALASNAVDSVARANIAATSNAIPTSAAQIGGATNVSGGILTYALGLIGLTPTAVSNAVAGVYALANHIHGWTAITGLGSAATNEAAAFDPAGSALIVSNSFTNVAALASTALQPTSFAPDLKAKTIGMGTNQITVVGAGWSAVDGVYYRESNVTYTNPANAYFFFKAGGAWRIRNLGMASFYANDGGSVTNAYTAGDYPPAPTVTFDSLSFVTLSNLADSVATIPTNAAQIGASPTGHVHAASSVTNLQDAVAEYGYLTNNQAGVSASLPFYLIDLGVTNTFANAGMPGDITFRPYLLLRFLDSSGVESLNTARYGYATNGNTSFTWNDRFRVYSINGVDNLPVYDTLLTIPTNTAQLLNGARYLTNVTPAQIVAAGGKTNVTPADVVGAGAVTNAYNDPYMLSTNLSGLSIAGTCTITRAMGNALRIQPTNTVYFTADPTMTDTNAAVGFTLDIFYNASTFGFVATTMSNSATLTSNAWNSIIFWKGYGATNFVGR